MKISPLIRKFWTKLWRHEEGFTLIEAVAATFIAGTVVVGSVVLMGTAVRTSTDASRNLNLQGIVQNQIETLKKSDFIPTGAYPVLTGIPLQVALTVDVRDPGTKYVYPEPDGAVLSNVVQEILVSATNGDEVVAMIFYKIESP